MNRAGALALPVGAESRPARLGSPLVLKVAAGLVLLALWEIVVRSLAPAYVARPSGIVKVFYSVMQDAQFLAAAGATLWAVVEGLFISLVAGIATGFLMGLVMVI